MADSRKMRYLKPLTAIFGAVVLVLALPTHAQRCMQKITAGGPFDGFGGSVALTDGWAVVGATGTGAAYVFRIDQNGTPSDFGLVRVDR